jgi:SAM-dependent methyltransferase
MDDLSMQTLVRLSWGSLDEYRSWLTRNKEYVGRIWLWHESLGSEENSFTLPGICSICQRQTSFSGTPKKAPPTCQQQYRMNWWSGYACSCGMSTLDRTILQVLFDECARDCAIYHVGHNSRIRKWLTSKLPNIISSQYEEGRGCGETVDGVRYEDITALSFPTAEFDCIICSEILEHLADYKPALSEIVRTLKPGGKAILSFPWLGGLNYKHLIRAELNPDGSINHIYPPEYHGNAASKNKILSFRAFGWKILDEMHASGFSRVAAKCFFAPIHGYMSVHNHVIVGYR